MLWLGLLQRDSGMRASEHLGIKDAVVAVDFNLAVTLRLLRYDNEKEHANKKFWVKLVTGEDLPDSNDVMDAEFISDEKSNYSTRNVW